jgi:hypothetical protein
MVRTVSETCHKECSKLAFCSKLPALLLVCGGTTYRLALTITLLLTNQPCLFVCLLQTSTCVGDVMWSVLRLCTFLSFFLCFFLSLLSDFLQTRPHFSISFCRHLEHCQVRIEFALQHY